MKHAKDLMLWMILGLIELIILFHWIFLSHPFGFPLDDSWIHMVFARCLWEHGMFCYNPGIPSTGDSSPLWAISISGIFGALHHFGTYAFIAGIDFFNSLIFLGLVIVCWRITYVLTENRFAANTVAGLLLANLLLLYFVLAGMEVYLAPLLMGISVLGFVQKRLWQAGIFLALACCVRAEFAMAGFIFVAYALYDYRGQWRNIFLALLKLTLPSILLGGVWMAYNYHVTHHILPAPVYFKDSFGKGSLCNRFDCVFIPMMQLFSPLMIFSWPLLTAYFFKSKLTPNRPFLEIPLMLGLSFALFNTFIVGLDGYSFYLLRYLIPAIPFLVIGLVIAVWIAKQAYSFRRIYYFLFGIAVVNFISVAHVPYAGFRSYDYINTIDIKAAEWIKAHVPANANVAISDAGAIRYLAPQFMIDTAGLNTPEFFWDHESFSRAHPAGVIYIWLKEWYLINPADAPLLKAQKEFFETEVTPMKLYTCIKPADIHFKPNVGLPFVMPLSIRCIPIEIKK